jgi:hypothetical protein
LPINREFQLFNEASTGLRRHTGNEEYLSGTKITGFCTAASLLFAKKCLETPTWFPRKREDAAWGDSQAQLVMHKLNLCNNNPDGLAGCAGLQQTTGFKEAVTAEQVASEVSQANNRVGIFWNSYHIIGIKQAATRARTLEGQDVTRDELHVWDQNYGFFSMGISDLGAYYKQYYPKPGWNDRDQIQGFLGLQL